MLRDGDSPGVLGPRGLHESICRRKEGGQQQEAHSDPLLWSASLKPRLKSGATLLSPPPVGFLQGQGPHQAPLVPSPKSHPASWPYLSPQCCTARMSVLLPARTDGQMRTESPDAMASHPAHLSSQSQKYLSRTLWASSSALGGPATGDWLWDNLLHALLEPAQHRAAGTAEGQRYRPTRQTHSPSLVRGALHRVLKNSV